MLVNEENGETYSPLYHKAASAIGTTVASKTQPDRRDFMLVRLSIHNALLPHTVTFVFICCEFINCLIAGSTSK